MKKIVIDPSSPEANIFQIYGRCAGELRSQGKSDEADELWKGLKSSETYHAAIVKLEAFGFKIELVKSKKQKKH